MKKYIWLIGIIFLLLLSNLYMIFYWFKAYDLANSRYMLDNNYSLKNFNGEYSIVGEKNSDFHDLWVVTQTESLSFMVEDKKLSLIGATTPKDFFSWSIDKKNKKTQTLLINDKFFIDFNGDGLNDYMLKNCVKYIAIAGEWTNCVSCNFKEKTAKTISNKNYFWNNNKWVLAE